MKNTIVILMLFLSVALSLETEAQNTLYFMDHLPQSLSFNPALAPDANLYFILPGVSNFGVYNSGFNYKELKKFSDNLVDSNYDPDNFVHSIGDFNKFYASGKANVFAFGFRLKDGSYLSFQQSLTGYLRLKAKSDLVYVLADLNNLSSEDFPIVVDDVNLKTNSYLSWSVTYSRKISEKITVGIRPGLNFNLAGDIAKDVTYIVTEDKVNDEYEHELDGEVLMGLPKEINPDVVVDNVLQQDRELLPRDLITNAKFSDFFRNPTLSVDLGAVYVFNDWTFSASLLNIGSSKWRKFGYFLNGNNDIIHIQENKKFRVGIPPKIYLAANRQFSDKWNYGLVIYHGFIKEYASTSATLSINGNIDKMVSTSFSYTAGYRFGNIGLGLRLRLLPGTDLFMVTDNIIQAITYKRARRLTAAFGINVTVGTNEKAHKQDLSEMKSL